MKSFEIFFREKFDNGTTTIYKHYQRFTRVLSIARQRGYMDRHPFPEYKIRQPKKKIEYLTQEEINKIRETDFKVKRLNTIRDIFLFCIYSGFAYAECERVSPDDITTGADGKPWIIIIRKKTKKPYSIPILPIAGIKKHLQTHLARKTFATTILLQNGINIGIVSRLLGHANVQVTLDAYGEYNDTLMLQQVAMIREKLVTKSGKHEIYKFDDNSATKEIVRDFTGRKKILMDCLY